MHEHNSFETLASSIARLTNLESLHCSLLHGKPCKQTGSDERDAVVAAHMLEGLHFLQQVEFWSFMTTAGGCLHFAGALSQLVRLTEVRLHGAHGEKLYQSDRKTERECSSAEDAS